MGSSDARSLGTFSSVSVFPVKRAGRLPAGSGASAEGKGLESREVNGVGKWSGGGVSRSLEADTHDFKEAC